MKKRRIFLAELEKLLSAPRYWLLMLLVPVAMALCITDTLEACMLYPAARQVNSAVRQLAILLYFDRFKGIMVALAATAVLYGACDDVRTFYIRSILARMDWKQYAFGKVLAVLTGTVLFVACSFLLFLIGMRLFMRISEPEEFITPAAYTVYVDLVPYPPLYAVTVGFLFGLFCFVLIMNGLALTVWIPSRFIASGIPFISIYVLFDLTNHLPPWLSVLSLSSGMQIFRNGSFALNYGYCCLFFLAAAAIPVVLYCVSLKRKLRNAQI